MKKSLLVLLAVNMLASAGSFAQRNCGTMDHLHEQELSDTGIIERMQKIENHTRFISEHGIENFERSGDVITIPVVVHVVYRTAAENVSDAQIFTQIQVLNEDFRRLNGDASQTLSQFLGVAADSEIEFCLASIAPNGTATNGITRTSTTVTAHGTNNSVKFDNQGGKNAWPAGSYLNMWVCNIGGGILGYAQFPGGSASTDGVVVDYRYFGTIGTATAPFNKGRTATHEVGHWLNLRHIWGDGACNVDDFVADTPPSNSPNYGCPLSTVKCNTLDMVQNYMDYTDDACMNILTQGQKTRMRALFAAGGARASLLSSQGCGGNTPSCSDGIQNGNETGVDCGGSCPPCPPSSGCLTYCTSRGNSTVDEFIQSVTLGSYTNNSGNNGGYASFNSTANFVTGQSYNFTLVPAWTGTVYPEYFRIWADWNQDGDFNDTGELVYNQGSASTATSVSGSFTVPSNATLGKTTFRVQMKYNAAPGNCETFSWGEVEDYCVNISAPTAVCNTPTGLSSTNITANSATLNWQAVSGATGYTVRARAIGQSTWSTGTTSGTTINYTGLSSCTEYEFQVSTTCGSQTSAFSGSSAFSTIGCVVQVCDLPTNLNAINITTTQVTLSWAAVSGAASYTVRAKPLSGTSWTSGTVTGTSVNYTGLSACNGYEFQVEANCSNGLNSGYTASAYFITPGCSSCTAPSVAYVDNISGNSARLNWSAMPNATRYGIRYRVNGTTSWTTVSNLTSTSYTLNGLACGVTYQYQLRTRCGTTWTAYGVTRTFTTSSCNREDIAQLASAEQNEILFNIYPNPASDFVNIETFGIEGTEQIQVSIFDVNGKIVAQQLPFEQKGAGIITIQTSHLSPGIYLVQLIANDTVGSKRMVITR